MRTHSFKALSLAFLLGVSATAFSQFSVGGANTFMTVSARGGLRLPNMENVEGSPYLDNEFHSATVRVKSGYDTSGILVKFNSYGNEIVFLNNGTEMALDSIDEVSYTVTEYGSPVQVVFKAGYPKAEGNTTNTIYRVLAAGPKVHLLKYYSKKLEDVKTMGEYNKKEFVAKEELYIYTTDGTLKKIKANKESLLEAFPELADKVETLVSQKKLKLKKEKDMAQLVQELNKS